MPSPLTPEEKHHPAKFSTPVLSTMAELMADWLDLSEPAASWHNGTQRRVLDPYSGVGWIHRIANLGLVTFAGELERPWARNHGHCNRTVQADAGTTPFRDDTFHAIATSVVYLNRMRDHHHATDSSERMTYLHQYQKLVGDKHAKLHDQNMGAMNNIEYRATAQRHIREFKRVTIGGGFAFVNLSNSIDGHEENNCVEQWLNWLTLADARIREVRPVGTRRMRNGQNYAARVEHEVIAVAQFPAKKPQATLL